MTENQIGEPPDPRTASTPAELAGQLRALRLWAGQPSLRQLRRLGGTRTTADGNGEIDALPESTTSCLLRGDRPVQAEFVRAFVAACLRARRRGSADIGVAVERWHEAWLSVNEQPGRGGPATGAAPVPRQLPADVAAFTGRARELAELGELVPDRPVTDPAPVVVCVITGTAGVGKTALAVHAAHRAAERFPDGQLFIDLYGFTAAMAPVRPGEALGRLLRTLGVPGEQVPMEVDDRAGLWRSVVAGRRMLIVLDNAATDEQVAPLLPAGKGCLVLVTSRRRLAGLDATHTVSLDVLPATDAVSLFVRAAGRPGQVAGSPPLATEAAELAELAERCGRLPLAIRIAAARLSSHPAWRVADMVARLRNQERRLAELADEDGPRSVAAALAVSYRQLSADQQRLYRRLGVHPGPEVDAYAAAALLGTDPQRAGRLLDQLLDAHLLQEPAPGRFVFHDLVRAHATHTAATIWTGRWLRGRRAWRRCAAVTRLLGYYRHAASVAMDAAYPYEHEHRPRVPSARTPIPDLSDPTRAIEWLDLELPNLLAAAWHAAGGWPEHTWQLPAILRRHLHTRGRYHDAEHLHHQALTTARGTGHRAGELAARLGLGDVHRLQGRHEQALADYREALAIARTTGHCPGELEARIGLGRVHRIQGRYEQVRDDFGQALEIARATGNRHSELNALLGLGEIHVLRGRYEQALADYWQALAIARATGNRHNEPDALRGLGDVNVLRGRHEQALADYREALVIARTTGSRTGQLNVLICLGDVHRLRGRHEQALADYEQARAIARATGNRHGELGALLGLSDVSRRQGRYQPAADSYQRVLDIGREIGDRNWQFEAVQGLGRLHHATGHQDTAIDHHRQALELATGLGQPADQARAHDGLAYAYQSLDQRAQARQHWRRALDILTSLGTDQTEDEEASVATVRAHLAHLDR